jgi:hypothetical protein
MLKVSLMFKKYHYKGGTMVPEEAMRSDAEAPIQLLSDGGPEERMNTQRIHFSEEDLALTPVADFSGGMENPGVAESPEWLPPDGGLPGWWQAAGPREESALPFPFLAFDDEDEDDDVDDDEDNFDDMDDDFEDEDDDFEDEDDDFDDDEDDDFEDEDDDFDYDDDVDYDDDFEE